MVLQGFVWQTMQVWQGGGKRCFSHTNASNFRRPSQSLLLRYTAETDLILICSFSLCQQNFSKANCFRVYRNLVMWPQSQSLMALDLVRVYSRPFVSKLWHDIRAVFCHVYLRSFLLCGFFFPSKWSFSSHASVPCKHTPNKNTYICAQHEPMYTVCVTNYMTTCAYRESSYKRHRIIPSAINHFMYDRAEK